MAGVFIYIMYFLDETLILTHFSTQITSDSINILMKKVSQVDTEESNLVKFGLILFYSDRRKQCGVWAIIQEPCLKRIPTWMRALVQVQHPLPLVHCTFWNTLK